MRRNGGYAAATNESLRPQGGQALLGAGWRFVRRIAFQPEFGVLLALCLSSAIFTALSPHYVSTSQLGNIMVVAALNGIPAIGVTFLIISGEFDLSVGTTFALSPMIFTYFIVFRGWSPALALVLGLGAACLVGLTNAVITTRLRIPSFITTLGMSMFLEGLELVFNGGSPVDVSSASQVSGFLNVMGGPILGSQFFAPTLWFVALGAIAFWILRFRRFGNWACASGGNADAARAVGVPVTRVKSINFVMCSLLAGFTGLMQLGYVQQWNPGEGQNLELNAIVIAVLGGASLFGGVGSILGTIIAAVFMSSLSNGLVLIGAPGEWYTSFVGLILVVAVIINVKTRGAAAQARARQMFRGRE